MLNVVFLLGYNQYSEGLSVADTTYFDWCLRKQLGKLEHSTLLFCQIDPLRVRATQASKFEFLNSEYRKLMMESMPGMKASIAA